MIVQNLVRNGFGARKAENAARIQPTSMAPADFLSGVELFDGLTVSQQTVTAETSRNIATAYRCINVLSDDVAKLPLQTFASWAPGRIERVKPSSVLQNISWLLEVSPNRWMTPLVFKKVVIQWLLTYGAAYIWQPPRRPGRRNELFVLPSNITKPVVDEDGQVWYEVTTRMGVDRYPDVEVLALLINSTDGVTGKSVISYARETMGRQLANYATQGKIAGNGLNPSGVMYIAGDLSPEARKKVRGAYQEAMSESGVVIFDQKVTKFETITMKPTDAQFLESIAENDVEISNFFGVPLYKLNLGKQSYQSNEQQNLDYLNTTLDPYLVQWEQAAALKWLSETEQNAVYFRFNRDALLRTDAKTRSEMLERRILSGQLSPNEARQIEDQSAFPGGDTRFIPANMAVITPDGAQPITAKTGGDESGE